MKQRKFFSKRPISSIPKPLSKKLNLSHCTKPDHLPKITEKAHFNLENDTHFYERAQKMVISKGLIASLSILGLTWDKIILCSSKLTPHIYALDQHAVHERVRYFFFSQLYKWKILGQSNTKAMQILKKFRSINLRYKVNGYKQRKYIQAESSKQGYFLFNSENLPDKGPEMLWSNAEIEKRVNKILRSFGVTKFSLKFPQAPQISKHCEKSQNSHNFQIEILAYE